MIDYFQDKKILFVRSRDKKDIIGLISQDKKILSDEYFSPPKKENIIMFDIAKIEIYYMLNNREIKRVVS